MKRYAGLDRVVAIALLVVVVVGALLFLRSGDASSAGGGSGSSAPSSSSSAKVLDTSSYIARSRLPTEARDTITRIQAGGPFPFDRDGIVFQNREGLLPAEPRGFYHEYTVTTPGSSDRGPRRIVQAPGGVLYWSPDHYRTFRQIALAR